MDEKTRKRIANLYLRGMTGPSLASKFGVSTKTIYKALQKSRVNRRPTGRSFIVRNPFVFNGINSEKPAYWLGFIAADGCLHRDGGTLTISLARQDKAHLERFIDFIDATYRVKDISTHIEVSMVQVYSKRLYNGLVENRLLPNKTNALKWPSHLPDNVMPHFIRGYVDGDGGFYATSNKYCKGFNITFQVTSFKGFIIELQLHLMDRCGLNKTKLSYRREGILSPTLRYCGRHQVKRIFDYIYEDATVWLPRKRDKIEPYL